MSGQPKYPCQGSAVGGTGAEVFVHVCVYAVLSHVLCMCQIRTHACVYSKYILIICSAHMFLSQCVCMYSNMSSSVCMHVPYVSVYV